MSVWEQRQYADPHFDKPASQSRKRQPSVAARSIWEALYFTVIKARPLDTPPHLRIKRLNFLCSLGVAKTRTNGHRSPLQIIVEFINIFGAIEDFSNKE